jgi:hypothetical protein
MSMSAFEEPGAIGYFVRLVKAMRRAHAEHFVYGSDTTLRVAQGYAHRVDAFILDFETNLQQRQPSMLPKKEQCNEPN